MTTGTCQTQPSTAHPGEAAASEVLLRSMIGASTKERGASELGGTVSQARRAITSAA
ncbi:hypothetical protein BH23GEM9_BH23GEM9_20520 [soil metagenome]